MTPVTSLNGKHAAVFGLATRVLSSAQALLAGGARVAVWDDNEHAREKARAAGLRIENLALADWRNFASLVLSPGVPLTHPAPHWTVLKARQAGVEIIGDIELFCRERQKIAPGSPFVAITGTNGKSTTAALVAHLFPELRFRGRDWRQYRHPDPRIGAAGARARSCRRVLFVSDRSRALAQSIRGRASEYHARSPGPPRHDGKLCRDQGKAGGKCRSRGDRNRRRPYKGHRRRTHESGQKNGMCFGDQNRDRRWHCS